MTTTTLLELERTKDLSRKELGELFRSYRLAKNLSQEDLTEITGLTQATISSVEKGYRGSPETWVILCEALDMDLAIPLRVMAGKDPTVERYGPEVTAWAEQLATLDKETRELIFHTIKVMNRNEQNPPRKISDEEKEKIIEDLEPLRRELKAMSEKLAELEKEKKKGQQDNTIYK